MRKLLKTLAVLLIGFALLLFSLPVFALELSSAPTRIINVVYDDSGSMIITNGVKIDTWCLAKYAMEVFSAMLGEKDVMHVYYMSDFDYTNDAGPKLTLRGSDNQRSNVEKLHNTISNYGMYTSFNTVRKAYSDLKDASADEKWLVVLTDGKFDGVNDINAFFAAKSADVKVMFLGMGPDADAIASSPDTGVFFEKAETNSQILRKITNICTRVFNSDRLDVNASAKSVEFDVPMRELVVFAQGENVSVEGIRSESGKQYLSSTEPVTVRYSEKAAANWYDSPLVATNLNGCIATFKDDFPAGRYTLEVSDADTVEVYYRPNVEIVVYLMNEAGVEVTARDNLLAGSYTINFGFVKAGTHEIIKESALLGTVRYSAEVTNNGKTHDQVYTSGDQIRIEDGPLDISASAAFLEYNTVATSLHYSVFSDKDVSFHVRKSPGYSVSNEGVAFSEPIEIQMDVDGGLTQEQWDRMKELPTVTVEESTGERFSDFRVEKGKEPGVFLLYPGLNGEISVEERYGDFVISLDYQRKEGEAYWAGHGSNVVSLTDLRTRLTGLEIGESPIYIVDRNGLSSTEGIPVHAIFDGQPLTPELWQEMSEPILQPDEESGTLYGNLRVEKSAEPGLFFAYPTLRVGLMSYDIYQDYAFAAEYRGTEFYNAMEQSAVGRVRINDARSWLERNAQLLIRIGIILLILALFLGYIPPIKKYLPRNLKRHPTVTCTPNRRGVRTTNSSGRYEKNSVSTLIPFKAETGTIKYLPSGGPHMPLMRIKAAGGSRICLTNTREFAGNESITFNSNTIDKGVKQNKVFNSSVMINVHTKDINYMCVPNKAGD